MIQQTKFIPLMALAFALSLSVSIGTAQTVYWESFEDPAFTFDGTNSTGWGWFDWELVLNGTGGSIGSISSTGSTVGDNAFKLEPAAVSFSQGFAFKLQNLTNDTARRAAAMQGFLNNTHISFEVTWDNTDWVFGGSGWNGSQVSLAINYGPSGQYQGQGFPDIDSGNPNTTGHWDNTSYPGVHTRTVSWDYSALLPAIQALYDSEQISATAGWLEFSIETNAGNYSYPVAYYFDNFRFETPSAGLDGDFDGDNDVDGRDFLSWQRGDSTNGTIGGPVSAADLLEWQNAYNGGALVATSTIPEPSSLVLLGSLSFLAITRRR